MHTHVSKSTLVAFTLVCLSVYGFSQEANTIITYRGNTFEFPPPKLDTIVVIDPVTDNEVIKATRTDPWPVTINGKRIYRYEELHRHSQMSKALTAPGIDGIYLRKYLIKNLCEEFKKLPDGQYTFHIRNAVVIDKKGSVAYFENGGITFEDEYTIQAPLLLPTKPGEALKDSVKKKISSLLDKAPARSPAKLRGVPVPFAIGTVAFEDPFVIKDHKVIKQ